MHHYLSGRFLILLVGIFLLEYCLSPFFHWMKGRADLFYLLVLDCAFSWSGERVPLFALGIGFLRDFFGGHLFGIETACFALTGFLLYLGVQKLERDNLWVRLIISLLFIGLTEILSLGLGGWLEVPQGFNPSILGSIFWTTLYTTALSPFFLWFTDRWFKRVPVLKQYELF